MSLSPESQEQMLIDSLVETFPSGSVRDVQKGKLRYDLVPWNAFKRVVQVYTKGAEKYAPRNWELGQDFNRVFASTMRHLMAWYNREDGGQEGDDHAAQAAWNILALLHFEEEIKAGRLPKELDNRPLNGEK
jgi:hypothetical protein